MRRLGAFELDIQTRTLDAPATVKIALLCCTRGEDVRLFITPSARPSRRSRGINSVQDELDERHEWARRAFQVT